MPLETSASKPAAEAENHASARDTLADATNAQIAAYVNANVTDLASARAYLIRLTKVVRTLARRAAK